MTRDELKAYICNKIDTMDENEIVEFSTFLSTPSEDEKVVDELVSIKGEFKKLTILLQTLTEQEKDTKEKILPYITMYEFLQNSQESLALIPKPSLFNKSKFSESFGSFKSGFSSVEHLYFNIMQAISLRSSAQVGDFFNSALHEAIAIVEDKNIEDKVIVEVVQQGFIYKDEVLNYAKVKVNKWK